MSAWGAGYVTDVNYVSGYYMEQSIEFVRFAQLLGGVAPSGEGAGDRRYCELGYGLGLSLNLLAAAYPQMEFWGTDFSPAQALHACELGAGVLGNLRLFDDSFEEFERRTTPQFDFIALHGIWSWIAPEVKQSVLRILASKLKPGGAVYISYNALPGWSYLSPLRELLAQHARFALPEGDPATVKASAALEFVAQIEKNGAGAIAGNKLLLERLKSLRDSPREYLVHEYLHAYHGTYYFSQVASALETARLDFVGSSRVLSQLDGINLTPAAQQQLAGIRNPVWRQTVRDFFLSTSFRTDVFVRGALRLSPAAQQRRLEAVRLVLVVAPERVSLKITGALGETTMHENVYRPLLDRLAAAGADGATIGDLRGIGPLKTLPPAAAVEAACMLIAIGAAVPIVGDGAGDGTVGCSALNRRILERCVAEETPRFIVSPVTRNGHGVDRTHAAFMLAWEAGTRDASGLAAAAWAALERAGHRLVRDGKPIEKPEDNRRELEKTAAEFIRGSAPILERLRMLSVA